MSAAVSWLLDATRPAPVPDPDVPFVVTISAQSCLPFCATCVERCPEPGALTESPAGIMVDPDRCTGCGRCVTLCPAPGRAIRLVPAP